jgi:hypothetical protein
VTDAETSPVIQADFASTGDLLIDSVSGDIVYAETVIDQAAIEPSTDEAPSATEKTLADAEDSGC